MKNHGKPDGVDLSSGPIIGGSFDGIGNIILSVE